MADQTNLVQTLSVQLAGIKQGGASTAGNIVIKNVDTVRVGTDAVISALGAASGNTFSRNARLVVVTPLPGGFSSVQVRDGTVSVDVTGLFNHEQLSGSVGVSLANTRTGRSTSTDYSIQQFVLRDADGFAPLALHFNVQGIAADNSAASSNSGSASELSASVAGAGDRDGNVLILQGSITVKGHALEVVPDSPPPNV